MKLVSQTRTSGAPTSIALLVERRLEEPLELLVRHVGRNDRDRSLRARDALFGHEVVERHALEREESRLLVFANRVDLRDREGPLCATELAATAARPDVFSNERPNLLLEFVGIRAAPIDAVGCTDADSVGLEVDHVEAP